MLDYLSFCYGYFSRAVGFDHDRLFSNITGRSKDILHFECPETASITLTKSISPQLKSSYSIGLPKQRSAGFLFSSLGLNAPFSPNELLERTSRSRPKAEKSDEQRFLLYGRIFEDARLECLYFHKLNRNTMLSLSG
ncbi:hypothetical protein BC829DRAFT_15193 [Chytridium lagenaria]|nr:hypothetical protein BC829DRAFT_15193 [Chytridium lagenaria]